MVDSVLTGVVALNVMLLTGLSTWALRSARRTDSPRFWELSQLVALVGAAFVVGALHRLAVQAHRLGWWQGDVGGLLNGDLPPAEMGRTPHEQEVLALVGDGRLRDQEISEALHISPHTARTHVRNILRRSGLSDRRELVFISQMSARPGS